MIFRYTAETNQSKRCMTYGVYLSTERLAGKLPLGEPPASYCLTPTLQVLDRVPSSRTYKTHSPPYPFVLFRTISRSITHKTPSTFLLSTFPTSDIMKFFTTSLLLLATGASALPGFFGFKARPCSVERAQLPNPPAGFGMPPAPAPHQYSSF